MNADIEATLRELGPEYAVLAARLKAAPQAVPARGGRCGFAGPSVGGGASRRGALVFSRGSWGAFAVLGAAASLFAAVALAAVTGSRPSVPHAAADAHGAAPQYLLAYTAAGTDRDANDCAAAAVQAIIGSQRPDGSWGCDFLTRQNAAALAKAPAADVAYRKALRYLRSRGLTPLSREEFGKLGKTAARMVEWQTQRT